MPVIRDRSLDFRVQFSGPGSDLPTRNPPQSGLNQLKGTLEASSQDSCSFQSEWKRLEIRVRNRIGSEPSLTSSVFFHRKTKGPPDQRQPGSQRLRHHLHGQAGVPALPEGGRQRGPGVGRPLPGRYGDGGLRCRWSPARPSDTPPSRGAERFAVARTTPTASPPRSERVTSRFSSCVSVSTRTTQFCPKHLKTALRSPSTEPLKYLYKVVVSLGFSLMSFTTFTGNTCGCQLYCVQILETPLLF